MKKTIESLNRKALVTPNSLNEEDRTVEVVFTTDMPVKMYSWSMGEFFEALSMEKKHVRMDRLKSGAPLLDNHARWGSVASNVIGVVEKAWLDGSEGRAIVRFSKSEKAEQIFQDVKDGILRNLSVGYRVYKYEQTSDEKDKVPTYRAIDWEPFEISIVDVPADYKAQIKSDQVEENEVFIINHKKAMEENKDKEVVKTPETVNTDKIKADAMLEERNRSSKIIEAVKKAKLPSELAASLISEGATIERALEVITAEFEKKDQGVNSAVEVTRDEEDKERNAFSSALVLRSGVMKEKDMDKEGATLGQKYRSFTLLDMARHMLEKAGVKTIGMSKMEIAGRAITQTTGDFPIILENTLNKVLLNAYSTVQDTWRRFCGVGSVSDFREHNRYKFSTLSSLDKLNEAGEFKNKPIGDGEKETISADTYGNIINLTRQAIVNDDLNAFVRLAAMLGRAAGLTVEKKVYEVLDSNPVMSDDIALFHASHNNLATGADISVAALDAMRVLMASQKDVSNNEILDLRPSVLLTPIAIGGDARVIIDAQYDPDTANKLQRPNKVRGMVGDIVDTARLTGNAYYIFTDPMINPVLEVAFLDGVETPFVDMEESFSQDGIQWKVRHDFGVAAVDWRGAVKNPGA